ncbi:MAG TPA: serine hydrolase domain-containing protein [Gemmataceae bacterium]|nr:serine hydrolase domain-containing protein [Gemmataceae bacterium]
MTTPRKGMTRRAALAGLAGMGGLAATLDAAPPDQPPQLLPAFEKIPITGKAGPGLEPLDQTMLKIMDRHGLPGGAFAVAKDGKLLLAKGYGWANVAAGVPIDPASTLFGLASLSKTFTAVAVLKLVEQGKLGLDDAVFDVIKDLKPPKGARVDDRLAGVTVRQCLNHSGGWDRDATGDPVSWEPQICRAYRVRPPLTSRQFLSFTLTQPLNFNPGTAQIYSNVGYVVLGEVIAKASGQPYDRFIIDNMLKPMGITRAGLHAFDGKYIAAEALRYLAGSWIDLPALLMPMVSAAGGWSATVVDMARFLTNLDGSRGEPILSAKSRELMIAPPTDPLKPRENGTWFGLGWDSVMTKDKTFGYYKDGSYQGMRTYMKRLPTGVNWVLLYNASMDFDPQDMQLAAAAVQEVQQVVEGLDKLPDFDLFREYP